MVQNLGVMIRSPRVKCGDKHLDRAEWMDDRDPMPKGMVSKRMTGDGSHVGQGCDQTWQLWSIVVLVNNICIHGMLE